MASFDITYITCTYGNHHRVLSAYSLILQENLPRSLPYEIKFYIYRIFFSIIKPPIYICATLRDWSNVLYIYSLKNFAVRAM